MDCFFDRDAQADAAAALLAGALAGAGARSLVVTGGSSPGAVYDRLAALDLDWSDVTVTLSDDRWVDPASPLSNEGLIRRRLLTGQAAKARYVPLKGAAATPQDDAEAVEGVLKGLAPWSAVLLGMGEDGHIASLFPGDPDLAARLDPDGPRWCVGVPVAGLEPFVPRISLTARALLDARLIVLLISGEAKRGLVGQIAANAAFTPPVAAILRQSRIPVSVLWAP
jgi:6-phosphogluconolactonase